MKINRDELLSKLYEYSRSGHGLVLGSPGAGKSHSLIELNKLLQENAVPVLQITVDQLGSATPNDIKAYLGIDKTLSEKLKSEYSKSENPAVLIIDGFDAARNLEIQANLLTLIKDLISTLGKSWNILVSVRSFDAKKSRDLLKLFPRRSNAISKYIFTDVDCENFFIPALTAEEVLSVKGHIPNLEKLYNDASDEFKGILRNPFNLWLLKKISEKNKKLEGLDKIGSEVQLLDKFWENYISSTADSEAKEAILSALTKDMVTGYALSVRKNQHYQANVDSSWKSLFSDEILILSELTGQRVSFSHNILFDYAVSRLVIDEDINEVVKFLTHEPARALFLRPSLTYYYARLWFADRDRFWSSFSALLKSDNQNLRIFARLVPASVAVKLFIVSSDFDSLDNISKNNTEEYTEIVTRILQAYDFIGSQHDNEWLNFLKKLSLNIRNEYLWNLAKLTSGILDRAKDKTSYDLCGEIGRNLLEWIWNKRKDPNSNKNWLDGIGSNLVISIIAKTFETNPNESEKIIRDVLGVIKEENFPIYYIYRLTNEMSSIWPTSPSLVGDIYRVVFSYQEQSLEATPMGTPVMPMTSNRRQDFQMCHYHLVQEYPDFIESAPIEAIMAGIDCLNTYIWQEHITGKKTAEESKNVFRFRGKDSAIIRDYSYIWDERSSYQDEQFKISETLFDYIKKNLSNKKLINDVLDIFSQKAVVAFLWKHLLNIGSSHPEDFASNLFDLCLVEEIVDGQDTEYEAVEFIIAAWVYFTEEQRNMFQTFLMNLDSDEELRKKYIVVLQEKVISKLSKDTLTNDLAIKLKDQLTLQGRTVENRPLPPITVTSRHYSEEEYLKDQGTNLNDPNIKILRAAWSDLSSSTKDLLNGTPTKDQVSDILSKSKTLFPLLSPKAITVDKTALTTAWRELTGAIEIVTRSELEFNSDNYSFVKKVLLKGMEIQNPWNDDFDDEKFTSAAYSPYAKTEVARSLPWLARSGKDQEVLNAITKLSNDPDPSVRYLVCREVWRMRGSCLEEVWKLLDEKSRNEKNSVVLGSLTYSLGNTFFKDHRKGETILTQIFESLSKVSFSDEDIKGTLDIILWLHLENKSDWATGLISAITQNPKKNLDTLNIVIGDLLEYLLSKTLKEKPNLFHAAKQAILTAIPYLWKDVEESYKALSNKSSKDEVEKVKSLYRPIDNIVTRLYFAANIAPQLRNKEERALSDENRKEFYLEIKPILTLILEESKKSSSPTVFAPTAHHFMELISGVLSYDVSGVLKMAADLLKVSESSNYNLDSMAMSEVVKLTEATLADHRSDLQNNENITNLLRLLDSFAKTGWSDALRLVWRLDEIYR